MDVCRGMDRREDSNVAVASPRTGPRAMHRHVTGCNDQAMWSNSCTTSLVVCNLKRSLRVRSMDDAMRQQTNAVGWNRSPEEARGDRPELSGRGTHDSPDRATGRHCSRRLDSGERAEACG